MGRAGAASQPWPRVRAVATLRLLVAALVIGTLVAAAEAATCCQSDLGVSYRCTLNAAEESESDMSWFTVQRTNSDTSLILAYAVNDDLTQGGVVDLSELLDPTGESTISLAAQNTEATIVAENYRNNGAVFALSLR